MPSTRVLVLIGEHPDLAPQRFLRVVRAMIRT